jgi:uncharacterized membrane protein YkoI
MLRPCDMMRVLLVLALLLGPWAARGPAALAAPSHEVAQADVLSLGSVLETIAQRFPGHALDAQLSRSGQAPVYRIKWLGEDGRVRDIRVDARTGEILQVR